MSVPVSGGKWAICCWRAVAFVFAEAAVGEAGFGEASVSVVVGAAAIEVAGEVGAGTCTGTTTGGVAVWTGGLAGA